MAAMLSPQAIETIPLIDPESETYALTDARVTTMGRAAIR
jgi:hypothetical protein